MYLNTPAGDGGNNYLRVTFEGVEFTDDSKLVLSCLRANGLPSVILVVQVGLISFSDFNFRMRALVNRSLGFRDYPTKKEEAC